VDGQLLRGKSLGVKKKNLVKNALGITSKRNGCNENSSDWTVKVKRRQVFADGSSGIGSEF